MRFQPLMLALVAGACAQASPPMEAADGSFLISARAAPVRGGATGAYEVAYKDAQAFCAQRGQRAVLEGAQDRDIYQSGYGGAFSGTPQGGYSGAMGGGTSAAGSATIRFRCV
jgi:hypothetical protein